VAFGRGTSEARASLGFVRGLRSRREGFSNCAALGDGQRDLDGRVRVVVIQARSMYRGSSVDRLKRIAEGGVVVDCERWLFDGASAIRMCRRYQHNRSVRVLGVGFRGAFGNRSMVNSPRGIEGVHADVFCADCSAGRLRDADSRILVTAALKSW
jgi:hypothetical protein